MPVIPKIAGGASVLASIYDIHKTAMIYSRQEYNKAMGDSVVSCSIGNQKADHVSVKDANRKNWMDQNHFMSGWNEGCASVRGYFKGMAQGIVRYLPKFILAAIAIIPKKTDKKLLNAIPYLSTIALACVEAWDFYRNGTEFFEKTDYLKRK